ncbi:MAG: hypothetical protein JWN70_3399 [Planctomycetaceae bacterium]|nr:hypothetical protein [Planctomycetaceae bacterium]
MMRVQQNVQRLVVVIISGMILVGTAAIAMTSRYSEPPPLSDSEILRVHSAIHAIAPGDIRSLQQNRDGSVTAFVSSSPEHKQTVIATKVDNEWRASVTVIYF